MKPVVNSLLLLACSILLVNAACPHLEQGLVKWSTVSQWNQLNAVVQISETQKILLDVSPPKVKSVEVRGTLVFNNAELNLDAEWIKVYSGGKLIAGSEDCPIDKKVVVTLHGNRTTENIIGTDVDGTPFGYKGLVVMTGGSMQLFGFKKGASWARLTQTARKGTNTITLDQDISGWQKDDKIVIATTDFSWVPDSRTILSNSSIAYMRGAAFPNQNEVRTIVSVSGRTITLDLPLNFTHWGQDNERAEVGLLTHRIVVQGDEDSVNDRFGGHVMMRHGALIQISAVEFTRLGQGGVLGRYPVHFHDALDVFDQDMYVVDSSIHNLFQRCLVIHETHGVIIRNNVAYDTFGHCYFLEDGAERGCVLENNLGIHAKPIGKVGEDPFNIVPSDIKPSIFWLTNPNNTYVNNVAVGGTFGFWFLMPNSPINALGEKYYAPDDLWVRPRMTPLYRFEGNMAHSCLHTCFQMDDFLKPDGTTEAASYSPRQGPFLPGKSYPSVEAHFKKFTAYKCRQFGVWGKSSLRFSEMLLMDNKRGFMTNGYTLVENSVFIGETDNIGEPLLGRNHTRSYPDIGGNANVQISGHESYDNGGPQYSKNNVFKNFISTPTRKAGALGCLQSGPFMLDTRNRLINLTFDNANRIYLNNKRGDNEYGWAVLDIDGSTTDIEGGAWIVSNGSKHLLNPDCTYREDWNAWVCPPFAEGYIQIVMVKQDGLASNTGTNEQNYSDLVGKDERGTIRGTWHALGAPRTDGAEVTGAAIDCALGEDACTQYMHNVQPRKAYTMRFVINEIDVPTPSDLSVQLDSAMPGDWVIVAIPYPKTATFNVTYKANTYSTVESLATRVNSINDLAPDKWFYDTNTEHFYMVFSNRATTSYNTKWGFTDYNFNVPVIRIRANCGGDCIPTKLSIPPAPTFSTPEDRYQADLQPCQLTSQKPNSGIGRAFFMFYPEQRPWMSSREIHYNIYHDRTATVTGVELYSGAFQQEGKLLLSKTTIAPGHSPLRGIWTLSYGQWVDLIQGNLYVVVKTTENPQGALRGQIGCVGKCTPPAPIPVIDACKPSGNVLNVFSNSKFEAPWSTASYTSNPEVPFTLELNNTNSLCGNSSIKFGVQRGVFSAQIKPNPNSLNISLSTYKYFEFFAKAVSGYGEIKLSMSFRNITEKDLSSPYLSITPNYIQHFIVDDTTWTRVRVPLIDLGFTGPIQTVQRVSIAIGDSTSPYKEILIDEMRFSGETTESLNSPPTNIVAYNPNICVDNGIPTIGEEGDESSASSLLSQFAFICVVAFVFSAMF